MHRTSLSLDSMFSINEGGLFLNSEAIERDATGRLDSSHLRNELHCHAPYRYIWTLTPAYDTTIGDGAEDGSLFTACRIGYYTTNAE